MGISRKRFLQALAAIAAMGIPRPKKALAAEGGDAVLFDSELALDYAERFVKDNYTATAGVENPVPIVDAYGEPAGYAIDVVEGGTNSGYVLLDVNCPYLITSFCFDKGTVGPYERRMQGLMKSRGINIWNYTATTYLNKTGTYGGSLGTTEVDNAGPGFLNFCSSRGFTQGYTKTYNPSFVSFQNQISRTKHSVFASSITKTNGEVSGHAMSVAGWACLKRNGQTMNTLHVYDGWGSMVFLNYSYSGYGYTHGTYF